MDTKTNVMRILDQKGISYNTYNYSSAVAISGMEVASIINKNPSTIFKTLVTISNTKKYYVFMVPVNKELDLKKGAKSVNEKKMEMLKQKDLLSLTGYVHGGCSPIGMKKQFITIIDNSAESFDSIIFSAGKIGYQVELSLNDLKKVISIRASDIT